MGTVTLFTELSDEYPQGAPMGVRSLHGQADDAVIIPWPWARGAIGTQASGRGARAVPVNRACFPLRPSGATSKYCK